MSAATAQRTLLAKAVSDSTGVEESSALQALEANAAADASRAAVVPECDPEALWRVVDMTPHLTPCFDAICNNVDGLGYQAVPVERWLDQLDSDAATDAIAQALAVEEWHEETQDSQAAASEAQHLEAKLQSTRLTPRDRRRLQRKLAALDAPEVATPEEGEAVTIRDELRVQLARERAVFTAWFRNCCSEQSFVDLRKALRLDVLVHGWGCIEWLRDRAGRLRRLSYVPAYTVRPLENAGPAVAVEEPDPLTLLSATRTMTVFRRFAVYVQHVGSAAVYFKSPRDPRVISRATGTAYATLEAMRRPVDADVDPGEGEDAQPANELQWIARHDPRTPCPSPVWIGNLSAVLAQREADGSNLDYLQAGAVPAGMLMVHGGTVNADVRERLEALWRRELKQAHGANRVIIVEAVPSANVAPGERTAQPAMTYQSLRDSQQGDATFAAHDKRTADRVGASFRLPPTLVGYTPSELNRATANAALEFAEQQVFQPMREQFDWMINREILPELGIQLLAFRSNAPATRSPEDVGQIVRDLAPHGGLLPQDVRDLAAEVTHRPLPPLTADWAQRPIALTLAGVGDQGAPQPNAAAAISEQLRALEAKLAHLAPLAPGDPRGADWTLPGYQEDPTEDPDAHD